MSSAFHRIDRRIVHRAREENVVIGDVRKISVDPEEFECDLIVDTTHTYFFDHPLDHVPGMLFMEAGRQMGLALSHLFMDVPAGSQFISRDFRIRFDDIAELDRPVVIRAHFEDQLFRQGQLASARLTGQGFQDGRVVCTIDGDWAVYRREVYERLRGRSGAADG